MIRTIAALTLLTLAGCASSSTDPDPDQALVDAPVEVTLDAGETKLLAGGAVNVTFVRVPEDSRCPVDVTCVWEGNAVVEVALAVGNGPTVPVQINTRLEPRAVTVHGLSVTVLALTPEPRESDPPEQGDYAVTLRIAPA